eukprot:1161394-Pelagomonas_calceolata.AAC.13
MRRRAQNIQICKEEHGAWLMLAAASCAAHTSDNMSGHTCMNTDVALLACQVGTCEEVRSWKEGKMAISGILMRTFTQGALQGPLQDHLHEVQVEDAHCLRKLKSRGGFQTGLYWTI